MSPKQAMKLSSENIFNLPYYSFSYENDKWPYLFYEELKYILLIFLILVVHRLIPVGKSLNAMCYLQLLRLVASHASFRVGEYKCSFTLYPIFSNVCLQSRNVFGSCKGIVYSFNSIKNYDFWSHYFKDFFVLSLCPIMLRFFVFSLKKRAMIYDVFLGSAQ